jgi:hypothetical protein
VLGHAVAFRREPLGFVRAEHDDDEVRAAMRELVAPVLGHVVLLQLLRGRVDDAEVVDDRAARGLE